MKQPLKKTTERKVREAVLESVDALTIFSNTVEKLKTANDKLHQAQEEDMNKIKEIENNVERANIQLEKNTGLIARIEKIIGG